MPTCHVPITVQLNRHAHSLPTNAYAHSETGALQPNSQMIKAFQTRAGQKNHNPLKNLMYSLIISINTLIRRD